MHLILSSDTTILPKIKLTAFQHEDVAYFYNPKPESVDVLKKVSEKDFAPNEVCNYLQEKQLQAQSVIIFSGNASIGYNEAIRLACHIRFHNFTSGLDKLPITFVFDKIPNPIFDKSTMGSGEIQNFQYEEGFYFIDAADLFATIEDEAGQLLTVFEKNFNETIKNKRFAAEQLETIKILPSKQMGNHEISNLWGAVNLARNAGFYDNEIGYQIPQTLYFKYLSRKYSANSVTNEQRRQIVADALIKMNLSVKPELFLENSKLNFSNHPYLANKRILLIDDNADKGWKNTLSLLFNCTTDIFDKLLDINTNHYYQYDLVFLDLYMPNPAKGGKTDMQYTIKILAELKSKYPHIPIIVFTASNKSWTMHEVLEMGADGIYVKESPEYAADPQFSQENFKSFLYTVINCLEKYSILRPYWEMIQLVTNDVTFKRLPEKGQTQFKNRIIERLEMFYGLLKKGFEQHDYDKKRFHFSDYEMAFMTLWSILNEISEYHFHKSKPNLKVYDKEGNLIKHHPCNVVIKLYKHHHKWELIDQGDVFVDYTYALKYSKEDGSIEKDDSGRFYEMHTIQQSNFSLNKSGFTYDNKNLKTTTVNFENALFVQIAFILKKRLNLYSSPNLKEYLEDIVYLNEERNKLYLTHGEQISAGFYDYLESKKRDFSNYNIKPLKDIKVLFELITFLLTGQEIKLAF